MKLADEYNEMSEANKELMDMEHGKHKVSISSDQSGRKVQAVFSGFAEGGNNGKVFIIGRTAVNWEEEVTRQFKQRVESTEDRKFSWSDSKLKKKKL